MGPDPATHCVHASDTVLYYALRHLENHEMRARFLVHLASPPSSSTGSAYPATETLLSALCNATNIPAILPDAQKRTACDKLGIKLTATLPPVPRHSLHTTYERVLDFLERKSSSHIPQQQAPKKKNKRS